MAHLAVPLSLLLALTLSAGAGAYQATPVASPAALEIGACTTAPRSIDQMRNLITAGLPPVVALFAGTPAASDDATPLPMPSAAEPADEEPVEAVKETIFQFVACNNAGNLPAAVALLTDQAAGSYLAFAFMPFRELYEGLVGTPAAGVDPDLMVEFEGTAVA